MNVAREKNTKLKWKHVKEYLTEKKKTTTLSPERETLNRCLKG